jgi:hypothetical protein
MPSVLSAATTSRSEVAFTYAKAFKMSLRVRQA